MMGRSYLQILGLIILPFLKPVDSFLERDSWITAELYHSLDHTREGQFDFRGNVTIPSLNIGLSNMGQEALTDQQRISLEMYALENNFYKLKATVHYPNGLKHSYISSTKACAMLLSQLNDVIWISIDESGFVTSVTQAVANTGPGYCSKLNLFTSGLEDFNTDILIRHMELAPIPDTASFIQKMERERLAREKGDIQDNRGFFAKYWMYIIPVILLIFISGAANQDAGK